MNCDVIQERSIGPGSLWLTEKGLVVKALMTPPGNEAWSSTCAVIMDELCYWTVEIDRLIAELGLKENSNEVRHYLSVLSEAYGALEIAEKDSVKRESALRRSKVLAFTLARMVKTLKKTIAKQHH
jgi:hypothetical protein